MGVFSMDNTVVLTAAADWTARVWCVITGNQLSVLHGHKHFVRTAFYSHDSSTILTSSFDWTVKIWYARTGKVKRTLFGHDGPVNSAMWSADGRAIVSSSRDNTARMWCSHTGACLRIFSGHIEFVVWAVFAPEPGSSHPTRSVSATSDLLVAKRK